MAGAASAGSEVAVIVVGLMLLVWGGLLLGLARPLHQNWRSMVGQLRSAGFSRAPFGTRFIASQRGLRIVQAMGVFGVTGGALLVAVGLLR